MIRKIADRENLTIVFVEHDMNVVFAFATRVMVLVAGKLLVDAAPDIVRKDARVKEAYFGEDI
jgi:branched-chain amino acid transport system ATP-binding protein